MGYISVLTYYLLLLITNSSLFKTRRAKKLHTKLTAIVLSDINRFSKSFQWKIA